MTHGDETNAPQTLAAAREALARLRADIDHELAGVRDRIADLRSRDEAARRIDARAHEILGDLGRCAEPRG